jgi:hypothetical protein
VKASRFRGLNPRSGVLDNNTFSRREIKLPGCMQE